MGIPGDLKYSKDHEWVRIENDAATFGITDHAQEALGDIVYVELPETGRNVAQGEGFAVVESVKAVSDVYAPLAGEVTGVNEDGSLIPATSVKSTRRSASSLLATRADRRSLSPNTRAAPSSAASSEYASSTTDTASFSLRIGTAPRRSSVVKVERRLR